MYRRAFNRINVTLQAGDDARRHCKSSEVKDMSPARIGHGKACGFKSHREGSFLLSIPTSRPLRIVRRAPIRLSNVASVGLGTVQGCQQGIRNDMAPGEGANLGRAYCMFGAVLGSLALRTESRSTYLSYHNSRATVPLYGTTRITH